MLRVVGWCRRLIDVQGDQAWPQKRIQQYRATLRWSRNKRNIVGSCWLNEFDRFQTLRHNSQQHATTYNRECKRTQHVTPNNVKSSWPNTFQTLSVKSDLAYMFYHWYYLRFYSSLYCCRLFQHDGVQQESSCYFGHCTQMNLMSFS